VFEGIELPLAMVREHHHHEVVVWVVAKLREPSLAPFSSFVLAKFMKLAPLQTRRIFMNSLAFVYAGKVFINSICDGSETY
jgi:hypothetical protein